MRLLAQRALCVKPYVRFNSSNTKTPHDYCVDLLRKHDYENYLSTLLLPKEHAQVAFALRALNIELSNVGSHAKEDSLVQMRLQFWRDTVEKIYSDNPPDHPVAIEVHKVLRRFPFIKKNAMSKRYFLQLVNSRAMRITSSTFQRIEQMEQYAENTTSPIYYLQLMTCGIQTVEADHAFSHLGKGQGVTNLLRSVPYYAQRSAVILPQENLNQHKVSHEAIIRGHMEESLRDVVFEVASNAHIHLGKARGMVPLVHPVLKKYFLPVISSSGYLEKLRKVNFDIFHPSLQLRDSRLALKLLWYRWTGL